ncbi:MAG TPA: polyprenyl synthetase family protein [Gemmatimonadaceae bacterium]|jgi:farnesyl diphosphate synthase/geranylgeranyl diphosphate synthase type II
MAERLLEFEHAVDIAADRSDIDAAIGRLCDSFPPMPSRLMDAMRYSMRSPGKRLRGILCCASYRAAGGGGDLSGLAAAVEMLHAYSLAHDDLPCMDDDDMRRGRATTHRVCGVPATVVAGVAMIPLAARAAADAVARLHGGSPRVAPVVAALLQAAGASGMIGGQLQDLIAENMPADSLEKLERIHRAKTGALIAASARVGGIAAGADTAAVNALASFGSDLGLAFQIVDDVLDVTSSSATLGKTAGRDVELGKSTYPALLGVDGAMARAVGLARQGCNTLNEHNLLSRELRHLADLVITRTH